MTKEEYDAIMDSMKAWAGCASCQSYNGVRCRACAWSDAMDCVDSFYETVEKMTSDGSDSSVK